MNEQDRLIEQIQNNEQDRLIELLNQTFDEQYKKRGLITAQHTADHLIANNVTIPPVSVGQTIYLIRIPTDRPAWIDECEITYISVHYFKDGKSIVFSGYNFDAAECDIGETVFFTREEAEKVLEAKS